MLFSCTCTCLEDGLQDAGEGLLRVGEVVVELELDVEPDAAVDALERLAQRAERVLGPHLPLEDPPVLELTEQRLPSRPSLLRATIPLGPVGEELVEVELGDAPP